MRKVLTLGLTVIVIGSAVGSVLAMGRGVRWFDPGTERWFEVAEEPLVRRIPASGELRSSDASTIGCPQVRRVWNFTINSLATEGSYVRAGQPVVGFDNTEYMNRVRDMQNKLDRSMSTLEKTKLEQQNAVEQLQLEIAEARGKKVQLDQKLAVPETLEARLTLEKLRLDGELAEAELTSLQAQLEAQKETMASRIAASEAEVARARLQFDSAQRDAGRFMVPSPRDGFVVHLKNFSGDKPKVGESVWIGQSLLEIADLSTMEVEAEIAESDTRFVKVGQKVEVRLDAAPDKIFPGHVVELGRLFHEKSPEMPKMVFDAVIALDDPDPEIMRPGMAVKVEILSPTDQPVMHVPENAIRQTAEGPVLDVERGGQRTPVTVELGPRWNGRVIVEDGLKPGDRVSIADKVRS